MWPRLSLSTVPVPRSKSVSLFRRCRSSVSPFRFLFDHPETLLPCPYASNGQKWHPPGPIFLRRGHSANSVLAAGILGDVGTLCTLLVSPDKLPSRRGTGALLHQG